MKKNSYNWINDVYEKLRTLLSLYEETDCFNTVPEGETEEDIQEFINKKFAEIRKSAQTTSLYPNDQESAEKQEIAEKLLRIVDETEYFVRQYEVPGVVLRWKQINTRLIYFDCAFDLMEKCPEAYMKMRRGLTYIHLSCYPDPELVTQRNEYFAKVKEYYEHHNLEYSEEKIFQGELLNTLTLLFKKEFKKEYRAHIVEVRNRLKCATEREEKYDVE